MVLVDRALLYPAFDEGALCGREWGFVRIGRWHHFIGVGADDALPEFGVGEVARDEGAHAATLGGGVGEGVEAELGLAVLRVDAVATEAVVCEDGSDVGVVGNGLLGGAGRQGEDGEQQARRGGGGEAAVGPGYGARRRGEAAAVGISREWNPRVEWGQVSIRSLRRPGANEKVSVVTCG